MRVLWAFALCLIWGSASAFTVVEEAGRVTSILDLEVGGSIYDVSFDGSFGANIFVGDTAGADQAVDAIIGALNPGYDLVDNGHPEIAGIFIVATSVDLLSGYLGCLGYVCSVNDNNWHNAGFASGSGNPENLVGFQVSASAIPLPGAVWLFISGLGLLGGYRRITAG